MIASSTINRIGWVDWAKSFCMFLVILGHCHFQESAQIVIQLIYSFHMLLFFFISGYLCQRNLTYQSFLKDIRFIIVPYISYGLINIIIGIIRSRTISIEEIFSQLYALGMGFDGKIGAIWFLPSLFICKQLFQIIKTLKKYSPPLYYFIFIICFVPAHYISSYKFNTPFFSDSALCGLPFFFMGHESRQFNNVLRTISIPIRILIVLCFCVFTYYISLKNGFVSVVDCVIGESIVFYYINGIAAITAIIFACSIFENYKYHFITTTSYGTIVTLWCSGLFLTFFNYHLPSLFDYFSATYSLFTGFIYSILSYVGCYYTIILLDYYIPQPFGLRGNLTILLKQK